MHRAEGEGGEVRNFARLNVVAVPVAAGFRKLPCGFQGVARAVEIARGNFHAADGNFEAVALGFHLGELGIFSERNGGGKPPVGFESPDYGLPLGFREGGGGLDRDFRRFRKVECALKIFRFYGFGREPLVHDCADVFRRGFFGGKCGRNRSCREREYKKHFHMHNETTIQYPAAIGQAQKKRARFGRRAGKSVFPTFLSARFERARTGSFRRRRLWSRGRSS